MNRTETGPNERSGKTTYGYEAIILAGGTGSRLQPVVPDLPKVLAPVAGRPFLFYVINYLRMQGVTRFVFAVGYKAGLVEAFLKENFPTLSYALAKEDVPLGTGGAIRLALQKTKTADVLVVNGDTLFKINVDHLFAFHTRKKATCSIALKPMKLFDRFGTVRIDEIDRVVSFQEKDGSGEGLINGGVYVLNKERFLSFSFRQSFSFETAFLQSYRATSEIYGLVQDAYFIDIGVPEAYAKAQTDLAKQPLDLLQVDKSWTLFIDRDGVINEETIGDYILHWGQFIFSKGVLQSFKKLGDVFGRLLLVTNQRGVGKGLMTEQALDSIHYEMQREIAAVGGHLDKIYFCTDVDNTSFYRKPNPGMAVRARQDFPTIDFEKSIMVGNKPSDMRFGRAAGMYTVFLATTNPEQPYPHPDIDLRFSNLAQFVAALKNVNPDF